MSIEPLAVVFAKRALPGRVKTRLCRDGYLRPEDGARLAAAMLTCTVERLRARGPVVVALTGAGPEPVFEADVRRIDQGDGDLGARLERVWSELGGAVAFFGADTPDLPTAHLDGLPSALADGAIAVGPTPDGGYWTLAADRPRPAVLRGITWGSDRVFAETLALASAAGYPVRTLPSWRDVDEPADVEALRRRLGGAASDPHLARLATELESLHPRSGSAGPDKIPPMPDDPRSPTALDSLPADDLPELNDASILLVDDNLQNLELMHAYLEELPCAITTATDGVEAVEAIERSRPDLVLLDVMMPRMSGFEVCHKVKTNPETRDTIVIMVTALQEVGDFERAVECGTDDFLTKPVNKLELLTRVRSLLRVSLLRRRLDQLMALRQRTAPDDRGGE